MVAVGTSAIVTACGDSDDEVNVTPLYGVGVVLTSESAAPATSQRGQPTLTPSTTAPPTSAPMTSDDVPVGGAAMVPTGQRNAGGAGGGLLHGGSSGLGGAGSGGDSPVPMPDAGVSLDAGTVEDVDAGGLGADAAVPDAGVPEPESTEDPAPLPQYGVPILR